MHKRSFLVFLAVSGLGISTLLAQSEATISSEEGPDATLTIKIKGKLGPVLSGKDPEGGSGKAGSLTIKASESLSPASHTATSATYKLPAGSIVAVISGKSYKNSKPATMKISIPKSGGDVLFLSGPFSVSGLTATITGTAAMAKGAFPSSALKHPAPFKSPQKLTAAKSANGPGSKVSYSAAIIGKTVLGLTGTATD